MSLYIRQSESRESSPKALQLVDKPQKYHDINGQACLKRYMEIAISFEDCCLIIVPKSHAFGCSYE